MSKYRELVKMKKGKALELGSGDSRLVVCPDMGGRVFAEVGGLSVHRIDLDTVANPTQAFNMFGGNTFWPAPEGGKFGFNYKGDEWYVQEAVNLQPFDVVAANSNAALISKEAALVNRLGTQAPVLMERQVNVVSPRGLFAEYPLEAAVSYVAADGFRMRKRLTPDEALIGAWSLEQFDATPDTMSFCVVRRPKRAINFDYYEHPGKRIAYRSKGFTYKTDGDCRGQIGIRKDARASFIGFYDLSRRLVCVRQSMAPRTGTYFNIADNDQPEGPFSAADAYSIFNSDDSMRLFELETIGPMVLKGGFVAGSRLVSRTTFAVMRNESDLRRLIRDWLGRAVSQVVRQPPPQHAGS